MGLVIHLHGGSPRSLAWGAGGGPAAPLSLAWGHEQVTEQMAGVSHSLSRTSCIGKTPSVYKCHAALPWHSWLAGGSRRAGSWFGALESRKGEVSIMAVSWPPCAAGDLPFLLLLPRGSQCPGEKSLTPLPGRDSVGQRSCLSVCPADYFPRDPASWQLPSPSGFSGSSFPIPIPLFCTK